MVGWFVRLRPIAASKRGGKSRRLGDVEYGIMGGRLHNRREVGKVMTADLISLAIICAISFLCPVLSQIIPGRPIPETVFLLAGGMVAGPRLLGLMGTDNAISLLSDLGLGFLFLLAGYEIDPKNLKGREGKRGLITWFATLALAFAVVWLWPAFSVTSVSGMAVTIALTTTAIGTLLPILQENGVFGSRLGNAVLNYGTWGEVMPVIAMTLLLSSRSRWETMAVLGAFLAIAVAAAVLPKWARKAGSKLFALIERNANTNSQMLVRTVVLLLIVLVTVSSVFKLDIVLGAFAAGFVLRYVVPEGNEVMEEKLQSMGFGLFIPVFFICSGAEIDISAVFSNPALLVLFIVLLLLVRAVPIFVSMSLDEETRHWAAASRLTVAIYCTTALPLIVAVTSIAVSAQAMSVEVASVLIAAGAITVLVMPLLASVALRTVTARPINAAKEIADHPRQFAGILREHHRHSRETWRSHTRTVPEKRQDSADNSRPKPS
ncbi:cation:proton antiporter [Parvibacter caecicola]|uniref:Cation:proton antiporter n=2 Tax=Parvibacter caecicola TaxID=747645 RepID=A0A4T9T9G7_9ACTN|nr:cation:proton antiporter [Parvibacter caecicola]